MPKHKENRVPPSSPRSGAGTPSIPLCESSSIATTPDDSVLSKLLATMTVRERLVVCLKFADGLTLVEIAAVLNTGVAEVERILEHVVDHVSGVLRRQSATA